MMKPVAVLNLDLIEPLEETCTDDGLSVALYLQDQGLLLALKAEPGSVWEFIEDLSSAELIEWLIECLDERARALADQALLDAGSAPAAAAGDS